MKAKDRNDRNNDKDKKYSEITYIEKHYYGEDRQLWDILSDFFLRIFLFSSLLGLSFLADLESPPEELRFSSPLFLKMKHLLYL